MAPQTINIGDRVFIKSDKSKSKARDPYLVLSHVPNKPEVTVQKLLDHKNRSNVLTVQLQNIYKLPDPINPLPTQKYLPSKTTNIPPNLSLPYSQHLPHHLPPPGQHSHSAKQTPNPYTPLCFYCSNMGRPDIAHDDKTCHSLHLVKRPPIEYLPSHETDSSDDEGYQVPPLDNLPGPDALHQGAHDHAIQDNQASAPPSPLQGLSE